MPRWSILGKEGDASTRAIQVEERWRRARADKRDLEGEWWTNAAYYKGYHDVTWLSSAGRLDVDVRPSWKSNRKTNFYKEILETLLGLVCREDPGFRATPRHISARAERAAKATSLWIDHNWRTLHLARDVMMCRLWSFLGGRALLQMTWDEDAGELIDEPDLDALDMDGDGEPDLARIPTRKVRRGAPLPKVISPLQYYGDPLIPTLARWNWIITSSWAHRDEIAHTYGSQAGSAVPAEDGSSRMGLMEKRILHSMGGPQLADAPHIIPVREMYELPTDAWPEGRYIVEAGGIPLYEADNAYGDRLPFIEFGGVPSPGSYWDEALGTHMRPLQSEYNDAKSRHFDAGNLMGASKWIAVEGSIGDEVIDNEPGEIIEVRQDAPFMPVRSDPPPIGRHWLEVAEMARADLDRISGINDAARGRGEGFSSGRALAIAQEGVVTRLALYLQDHHRALESLGENLAKLAEDFVTEERMLRITGRDQRPLVAAFSSEDARLCDRVLVERSDGFPYSRIARMEAVMEAWEANLLVNKVGQRDPQKALDLLEFGDLDRMFSGTDLMDRRHAEMENELFLSGRQDEVEVRPWDDHQMHADVIRELLVSEEGRELERSDPAAFREAVEHRDMHIAVLAQSEAGPQPPALARPPVGGGAEGQGIDPTSLPPTAPGRQEIIQPGQGMSESPNMGAPPMFDGSVG